MTDDEYKRTLERNLPNDGAFAVAYAILKLAHAQESATQSIDRLAQAAESIANYLARSSG